MTKTEFFVAAYKLHDAIVRLLLHDMGVKAVTRDLKTFTYRAKMSQQDEATFKKLCDQYHIDVEDDFPSWLMDYYRENILHCLEDLMTHITNANSVGTRNSASVSLRFCLLVIKSLPIEHSACSGSGPDPGIK